MKKILSLLLIVGCSSNSVSNTNNTYIPEPEKPVQHGYTYDYQRDLSYHDTAEEDATNCTLHKTRADVGNTFTTSRKLACVYGSLTTGGKEPVTIQWFRDGKPTDKMTVYIGQAGVIGANLPATYEFEDGTRYEGPMEYSSFNGWGVLSLPKGHPAIKTWEEKHTGGWQHDDRYLVYGKWQWGLLKEPCLRGSDCVKYFSKEWITDTKSNCQVQNAMPDLYEWIEWSGKCKNGKVDGPGTVSWFDSKNDKSMTITGNYRDGKLNGKGKILYVDNSIFKGNFKDGIQNGFGELQLPKTSIAFGLNIYADSGEWIKDKYIVKGIFKGDIINDLLKGNTLVNIPRQSRGL